MLRTKGVLLVDMNKGDCASSVPTEMFYDYMISKSKTSLVELLTAKCRHELGMFVTRPARLVNGFTTSFSVSGAKY